MTTVLVSPTEPAKFKNAGFKESLSPETRGVDFMWIVKRGGKPLFFGVQRKQWKDLFASIADGRLGKEVIQMRQLHRAVLVVEGRPPWTNEGELISSWGQKWTKSQLDSLLLSMIDKGVYVSYTDDVGDTLRYVKTMVAWSEKEDHKSLETRPKAKSSWGAAGDRDTGMWLLQSIPGIGPKQAAAIWDQFKGVPLTWTVEREELEKVPGLGPKKVDAMVKMLGARK